MSRHSNVCRYLDIALQHIDDGVQQVKILAPGNIDIVHCSDFEARFRRKINATVDFGRVIFGTTNVSVGRGFVDNHTQPLPYLAFGNVKGNVLLKRHKAVKTVFFHIVGYVVGKVARPVCALLLAIGEGAHTLEPLLAHEIEPRAGIIRALSKK